VLEIQDIFLARRANPEHSFSVRFILCTLFAFATRVVLAADAVTRGWRGVPCPNATPPPTTTLPVANAVNQRFGLCTADPFAQQGSHPYRRSIGTGDDPTMRP